jgi:hypothetical protein
MNKTSVLHAPSWAHAGEFLASGTVWNFAACIEDTADETSTEGMTYLHTVRKLKQVASAGQAADQTAIMYLGYKWPTDDDYHERNGLSYQYITSGEGIIGLKMVPGCRIQEYVGTDYTNSSGVKMGAMAPESWATTANGALLYLNSVGQFTATSTSGVVRAQFIEKKGDWVIIEFVQPYITSIIGS